MLAPKAARPLPKARAVAEAEVVQLPSPSLAVPQEIMPETMVTHHQDLTDQIQTFIFPAMERV